MNSLRIYGNIHIPTCELCVSIRKYTYTHTWTDVPAQTQHITKGRSLWIEEATQLHDADDHYCSRGHASENAEVYGSGKRRGSTMQPCRETAPIPWWEWWPYKSLHRARCLMPSSCEVPPWGCQASAFLFEGDTRVYVHIISHSDLLSKRASIYLDVCS